MNADQIKYINNVHLKFEEIIQDHNDLDNRIKYQDHLIKLKENNEIEQLMIKHKEEIDKLRSERNEWIKHKNMLVHIYQQCDQKFPIELEQIVQLDDDEFL